MTSITHSGTPIDRKNLRRPDSFMVTVRQFFVGLSKHSRGVMFIIIGLVILGIAAMFAMNQREAKAERARSALYLAKKGLEGQLKAIAAASAPAAPVTSKKEAKPATPPEPGIETVLYKKLNVDSQLGESIAKFKSVSEEFKGTRAAFEARLAAGDLYFNHGEAAKAISWYQQAIEAAPSSIDKAISLAALGYSNENAGKYADAIQAFEKAINLGEASLKGEMLLAVARCHEALHDTTKARSTYDQIISQLPNTEYAKSAETFKADLR